MNAKERRERQKQVTRCSILDAAIEIAKAEGWAAVTIRRVAERIEYTPPIIYEYFASKDALLEEVQRQGFALLADMMQEASGRESDVRERILCVGDAYCHFAYEQPEFYQIMHGGVSTKVPLDRTLTEARRVSEIVQECFVRWAVEQRISLKEPIAQVEIGWAALHGLVSIEKLGRIGGGEERVKQLARHVLDALLTAWIAQ